MRLNKATITSGFAIFSMFFGSGNLVFPLATGVQTTGMYMYSLVGVILTAVVVPFLGVIGLVKHQGNRSAYFSDLTKIGSFLLNALIFLLVGPFGVIPRCITVAYGGMELMLPSLSLAIFSGIFCLIAAGLCWRENRVVEIIGIFLTPFKLGGIALLIVIGIYLAPKISQMPDIAYDSPTKSLLYGLSMGYKTMDLLAAGLIAMSIYHYLLSQANENISNQEIVRMGIKASLIGGSLLSVVYLGFIGLGAHYAQHLAGYEPQHYLALISYHALGPKALPIVSVVLAISCLATAVFLLSTWSEYLQQDIFKKRLSYRFIMLFSSCAAFAMSMLGFGGIDSILAPILTYLYPFLIVYALYKLYDRKKNATVTT